ncbi:unnamed protein product [Polarella glacialis]|uniref:RING-type domain-containing protein n=1 Tax=Polarella glacialis TaxID=89957 RepID=A0A813J1K4_POLGL|nr:unnamed protein product [Polarella glacialis]CAE8662319.1 unnamed protein product [Polarella glacialis]
MDFLEQLDEASFRKQQHAEQERAAKALIKDFQKKCSLAFLKGETECRHEDNMFFYNGNFPTDTSLMLLDKKLQETFGPICKTWVSFSNGRHGIVLAAAWPEPPQRAVQHWSSHGPRSNLISQCPVCLCRAEVVVLTPCGHMLCVSCSNIFLRGTACLVCREPVAGRQNLFS